jgi:hypothetical protein
MRSGEQKPTATHVVQIADATKPGVDRLPGAQQTAGLMIGKLLLVGALLAAAACNKAQSNSEAAPATATTKAVEEKKFGAGVSLTETTTIEQLLANPNAFKGKTIRVEGTVTDVCPKRGCWFELAGDKPGQKVRFKVTDGEMVFPMDSKGMYAVAQGQVAVKDMTLEETKQYAEYQAKEYGKPYDPASITQPMQNVRIDGTGAIFRDKK